MTYSVPVDLEDLNVRDVWILESRVDRQNGVEVCPLLIEILLSCILISSRPYGFLRSMELTQEIRSGGGREICHKLYGCGYAAET